ncbi:MAG: hypothetical protein ACI9EF_001993 [Pseudohongiellaceae bacterium]|jgi:hypothetical protein
MRVSLPALGFSVLSALSLTALSAPTTAQTLYGMDGTVGRVFEFNSTPGGPCFAPIPKLTVWPYTVSAPCVAPVAGLTAPIGPGSFGDIASDRRTNTVFVTDGFIIEQYAEFDPTGGTVPGTPINAFPVALPLTMTLPLTGMGMDSGGVTAGLPILYVTNGKFIAGIAPSAPGTCGPAALIVPPFPSPFPMLPGALLTDVTVDPGTGSLLVCDSAGLIHSIFPGGAPGPYGFFPLAGALGCGLAPTLEGIAMDLATTGPFMAVLTPPAFYVTDGMTVGYADITGGPAAPTLYTPVTCTPTPGPTNGLAYAAHSNNFAPAPGAATLTSFGQSSTPGPTYGAFISGVPAPSFIWLVVGASIPGPGFFCPPLMAVGNPLYVDPFTAPGTTLPLFAVFAPSAAIPLPIPAGLPVGVEIYLQAFLDLSPTGPGGPWLSTDPLEVVITSL